MFTLLFQHIIEMLKFLTVVITHTLQLRQTETRPKSWSFPLIQYSSILTGFYLKRLGCLPFFHFYIQILGKGSANNLHFVGINSSDIFMAVQFSSNPRKLGQEVFSRNTLRQLQKKDNMLHLRFSMACVAMKRADVL